MMAANIRAARVALVALAAFGSTRAFSPSVPLPLLLFSTSPSSSSSSLTQTQSTLVRVLAPSTRRRCHLGQQPSHAGLFLFGFGGGGSSSGAPAKSKARRAVESNAVFKSRTAQYERGAITAIDLVRSLERDVASKIPGCDLEDVIAAALEAIPDKRRRDMLKNASGGRAIGPGGSASSRASASLSSRGGSDVTVDGRGGQQYLLTQGGQRISSGKSTIFNGVEIGKEGTPLKIKVTSRSNAALARAEISNVERVRAKNGAQASSRHFVGFIEYVENFNGRGDLAMVMRAEDMDLRKLADGSGGGLPLNKIRTYTSEMASVIRCMHKAGLVWTDLKLDNMVLSVSKGKAGQTKAIDLESAVPVRSAPKAFSPEATPPDFFANSRDGYAGVTVDRSFDVWSLGMAILHLYLGRGYFEGSSDPQTIATLAKPEFAVDLSGVKDGRTRALLSGLLDPDPKKRLRYFDSPLARLALL